MASPAQASVKAKGDTAEQFVGSIFKFSISTVVNLGIYALAMVLTDVMLPDQNVRGEIIQFSIITNAIMTLAIFGLDQSYIRFHNEPPSRMDSNSLFRLCFYLSSMALLVGGLICGLFFSEPIYQLLNLKLLGKDVVPLVFLNAFFYMVTRYFYVRYRMEQNIRLYTVTNILQNFSFKLFYLAGAFYKSHQLGAMVACHMAGLGILAAFCLFIRRSAMKPRSGDINGGALKAILPFGLAVAPTAVMVVLNSSFSTIYVAGQMDGVARGIYSTGNQLSSVITAVQLGFASFWTAYMYANYKTQQARIKRVHDYLNLLILGFFALMVAFEDILFWVLGNSKDVQPIFPLLMLSAVFTVLCETTVYGNTIARRPIFDTIGNAFSFAGNILLCILLIPRMGLVGAAIASASANLAMFLFRTFTAQHLYRSIDKPAKTATAVLLAIALALAGTFLSDQFVPKLLVSGAILLVYCLMYRREFVRFWTLGISILNSIFSAIFKKKKS